MKKFYTSIIIAILFVCFFCISFFSCSISAAPACFYIKDTFTVNEMKCAFYRGSDHAYISRSGSLYYYNITGYFGLLEYSIAHSTISSGSVVGPYGYVRFDASQSILQGDSYTFSGDILFRYMDGYLASESEKFSGECDVYLIFTDTDNISHSFHFLVPYNFAQNLTDYQSDFIIPLDGLTCAFDSACNLSSFRISVDTELSVLNMSGDANDHFVVGLSDDMCIYYNDLSLSRDVSNGIISAVGDDYTPFDDSGLIDYNNAEVDLLDGFLDDDFSVKSRYFFSSNALDLNEFSMLASSSVGFFRWLDDQIQLTPWLNKLLIISGALGLLAFLLGIASAVGRSLSNSASARDVSRQKDKELAISQRMQASRDKLTRGY